MRYSEGGYYCRMRIEDLLSRGPLTAGSRLPWADPAFGARMLQAHLNEAHDLASRRGPTIDRHVKWLHELVGGKPTTVLDLACGPGLYTERLSALGHACVGVDINPAVIEYARAHTQDCEYIEGDITRSELSGLFELVLVLYGELSTFKTGEFERTLRYAASVLTDDGRLVIELSTPSGVLRRGQSKSAWVPAFGGLFADGPHLVLYENAWDDGTKAAVERWFVVQDDGSVESYATTTWARSRADLEAHFTHCGLAIDAVFGDVTGATFDADEDFQTLVLRRL